MSKKNMRACILKILFILISISIYSNNSDSLLLELDNEVGKRNIYMHRKQMKIDSLRKQIKSNTSLNKKYEINKQIFEEFYTYRYDSAMHYITINKNIAELTGNSKYRDEVIINMSRLLSTAGFVSESMNNIASLDRPRLDSTLLLVYYETMEGLYYIAKNYTDDSIYTPQYKKLERAYIDSIYNILPENSIMHTYYDGYRYFSDGQLDQAEKILLRLHSSLPVDSRLYAIVSSNLATINNMKGDKDSYEKYLVYAAISDQVCALKENTAMQRLAIYLSENKPQELTRAYQYINYSMEDAQFYNSRLRTVQIAQNMPIIMSAYQLKSEEEKKNLKIYLIIISILVMVLIGMLINVYRQVQIVKKNKKNLSKLNEQLNKLNIRLHNANRIRNESMRLFVDLSSSYIIRMESFRETVKRKILAKQTDDLLNMSNSSESINTMLESFFRIFDEAFLRLYPTFIDDFNMLLSDEGKIILKKDELLNTDLRVFALIKLGIKDSSKIAAFLHYSPQTIYNYRNKIKNCATVDRNDFEKYVQDIGEIM